MHVLSRSEEIALLAIWKLRDEAYGVTIREEVIRISGFNWTIGAIYAPLHRLEKKGYVKTRKGVPIRERGGRSKVYYTISETGKQALIKTRNIQDTVWSEILEMEPDRT
jgi:PadR family transcriptional regulator PadR